MNRSPLQRLSDEVRAACRVVVSTPSPAETQGQGHRVALGEWLGAVRQPQADGLSFALPRSRRASLRVAPEESRGDLSRTHIMRLKGERAHLEDGLDRSRRYSR